MGETMNEELIVDTCVEVSALLAGKKLSNEEAGEVLVRVASELCADYEEPDLATARMSMNLLNYVKVRTGSQ